LKLPDALLSYVDLEVNLHLEHSGHNLDIMGTGPDYTVQFPTLFSIFHYAFTFWPLRKQIPEGTVIHLKYRSFHYHYRA